MTEGHRFWIDLLNAQESWITDDSMLAVIPEEAREFESGPWWPRSKALAYLNNNTNALRLNYIRLESGEPMDLELLNLVLGSVSLTLVDWRRRPDHPQMKRERGRSGERFLFLQPRPPLATEQWNRGTAHIRFLVQRSIYHFARYADLRLSDPSYPGASLGMFRVLQCAAPSCSALVASPVGRPTFCSEPCSEDTGRLC